MNNCRDWPRSRWRWRDEEGGRSSSELSWSCGDFCRGDDHHICTRQLHSCTASRCVQARLRLQLGTLAAESAHKASPRSSHASRSPPHSNRTSFCNLTQPPRRFSSSSLEPLSCSTRRRRWRARHFRQQTVRGFGFKMTAPGSGARSSLCAYKMI